MTKLPALIGLLAALCAAPASGALYRCGNEFQDRPCADTGDQQVIKPGKGAAAPRAAASAPADRKATPAR